MKFAIVLTALATVATANMNVQLFTDDSCAQELAMAKNLLEGANDCTGINAPHLSVPETNKLYKYVRPSHIDQEVLLFEDEASCKAYPTTFDKNQEVAFLRSNEDSACVPCYRCGNVKSVKMVKMSPTETSDAVTAAPTWAAALLAAGVTAFFL